MIFEILLFALLFIVAYRLFAYPVKYMYQGKHIVIIGGSEGIGKEIALEYLKSHDVRVTIMARTEKKLAVAVKTLCKDAKIDSNRCQYVCIDATKQETIDIAYSKASESFGEIDVLVLSAGKACPGYILNQDISVFENTMNLNYLGAVRCVKTILPRLLKSTKRTQICFIGSACSVISFLGYGSYAPSKFALKGFADCLRNELSGTNISVLFAFPPDTDTPGFKDENETKPKENIEMFPPEVYPAQKVAKYIVDGMSREEYTILSPDIGQNLLISNLSGVISRNRWAPLFILLSPIVHVVFLFLRYNCDRVAKKYGETLNKKLT